MSIASAEKKVVRKSRSDPGGLVCRRCDPRGSVLKEFAETEWFGSYGGDIRTL
jgi:hypothetical protein